MGATTTSPVEVTVVVPVYNPGSSIEGCISSLLVQSLAPERFELIFVDDGSTDGTGERLDRLASQHAQVRVIHQPNSGWAGKPRNVGVDAATGTYVQFVDQDDTLGPKALERLCEFADRNAADIVIGKVTSNFRPVPHDVWASNVDRCSIRTAPLIESLTPHKMFRRSFLQAKDLRFPEGRRRLEDQHFMVAAYLATDQVAILGDYPCYFYNARPEGENAGSVDIDPVGYFANLREVLDIVDAQTAPGAFRDELHARFLRNVLRRVEGVVGDDSLKPNYIAELFAEARAIVVERFPNELCDASPTIHRLQASALIADQLEATGDLARALSTVRADVSIDPPAWADNVWRVHLRARLVHDDGSPVVLLPESGTDRWQLDPRLVPAGVALRADSLDELLSSVSANVSVRARQTRVEWAVQSTAGARLIPLDRPDGAHQMVVIGDALINPLELAAGRRIGTGSWQLLVRMRAFGITRVGWLPAADLTDHAALCLPVPVVARLTATGRNHRLSLTVRRTHVTDAVAQRIHSVDLTPGALLMPIPLTVLGHSGVTGSASYRAEGSSREFRLKASVTDGLLTVHARGRLPRGRGTLLLRLRKGDQPVSIAKVKVGWRRKPVSASSHS